MSLHLVFSPPGISQDVKLFQQVVKIKIDFLIIISPFTLSLFKMKLDELIFSSLVQ